MDVTGHLHQQCWLFCTQLFEAVYAFVALGYLESSLALEDEPVNTLRILAVLCSVLVHLNPSFQYFGQDGTQTLLDQTLIRDPLPPAVCLATCMRCLLSDHHVLLPNLFNGVEVILTMWITLLSLLKMID